jgi:hypothetical protein
MRRILGWEAARYGKQLRWAHLGEPASEVLLDDENYQT